MNEFCGNYIKEKDRSSKVSGTTKAIKGIENNSEGKIFRADVSVCLGSDMRRVGGMIIKAVSPNILPEARDRVAWPEEVMKKYLWLKQHGLPVVPTLRVDIENNRILMTDITEGGKKILIDKHRKRLEKTVINNRDYLKEELLSTAERAFACGNGVFLDFDAYSIVVNEHGLGKVYLLDLGLLSERLRNFQSISQPSDKYQVRYSLESAIERAKSFIRYALYIA